ncbi:hypothetical protein ACFY9N_03015 [Microbacterium sp. NPDC008134]|uniref:hypothetical protein n=1 Tax=Microbacterium sp. NPDC008134 TaxID=3364183 RepID=UPI0036E23260
MGEGNSIVVAKYDQRAVVWALFGATWKTVIATVAIAGVALGVFIAVLNDFIDRPLWLVSTICAVTLLIFVLVMVGSHRRIRVSMPVGSTSAISVTQHAMELEGHGGTSQFDWRQLTDVKRSGGAVLFRMSGTRLAIPGRMVSPEAFETILSRIEAGHGGARLRHATPDLPSGGGESERDEPGSRSILLTTDDLRAIRHGVWVQSAPIVCVLGVLGGGLIAAAVAALLHGPGVAGWLLAAGSLLFWGLDAALLIVNARNVRSSWVVGSRYSVRVTDAGVEFADASAKSQTRWTQISHLKQRGLVVTMTINGVPQIVPARLISPTIFALMTQNLAKA